MKKQEFVKRCAERSGLSQKDMKEVLLAVGDTIVECVNECVDSNDYVSPFPGVKFTKVYNDEHNGRNPRTGETIVIPGKYAPKIKFGKAFKDALN